MTLPQDATKSLMDRVSELFAPKTIGDIVTYEELHAAGCDIQRSRSIVLSAIKRFLKSKKLACKVVPRTGYQVLHPDETPRLIGDRIRKADRQIREGRVIAVEVDRSKMSTEVKRKVDMLEVSLAGLQKELRGVAKKVELHSEQLEKHGRAIEGLQEGVLGRIKPEDVPILERLIEQFKSSGQSS